MNKILRGIINSIFEGEEVEQLAEERILTCLKPDGIYSHCRFYNPDGILGPKCDSCGCVLKFKTRSEKAKCPIGKWEK